ncbi:MAG: FTR1 family protein [Chloroflexi bacterium]|nr:FTR1 family protein [Chloroflexota bacterium]
MVASLVIVAREVLEASLLLGVIFAYLGRTQNRQHFRTVWLGVAMAVSASVLLAVAVIGLMGQMTGVLEEAFEGFTMLLAGVVLTYVILWMKAHLHSQGKELQGQLQTALDKRSAAALASLAFLMVFREGAEIVLYLSAIFAREPGTGSFVGAGMGFGGAVVVGYTIYRGSRVLNLAAFFRVTTVILIVFAAGMVGQATLALQAAGLFPGTITLWDTSAFLPEGGLASTVLRSLVGYSSTPSLLQAIFYVSYLALVLSLYRDTAARPPSGVPDVPFAPIGSSYRHPLYRLLRRPGLTTVLAALMAIFLIGLLAVAIMGLHFGPFDNRGPLAWGPFTGEENENNLFNFAMWIIWLPLLSVGTVLFGRLWCGNLCPLRLATDAARGLADWLQGGSSPVAAYARVGWLLPTSFILVTFFVKLWPVQSVALYGAYSS